MSEIKNSNREMLIAAPESATDSPTEEDLSSAPEEERGATIKDSQCISYILPDDTHLVGRKVCDPSEAYDPLGEWDKEMTPLLTSSGSRPVAPVDSQAAEEPLPLLSPIESQGEGDDDYERERTFKSTEAPWVGAENAWRHGIVPPPHEKQTQYQEVVSSTSHERSELGELTEEELATVISSIPPAAHRHTEKIPRRSWRAVLTGFELLGLVAIVAVATWAIFDEAPPDMQREVQERQAQASVIPAAPLDMLSENTNEILPSPREALPEATPQEEQAESGEPSIEPDERPIRAREREEEAPRADEALDAEAPAAEKPGAVSVRDMVAKVPAQESGAVAPSPYEAAGHAISPPPPPSKAPSDESAVEAIAQQETKSPQAVATPPRPAPAPTAKTGDGEKVGSDMEAILLGAKTALPARKAYKSELNQILDAKPEQQEVKPLSDSAIRSTLAGISPRVAKCGNGEASTVLVKMVVSGQTGRIIDAKPTGKLARTSVGLCVSRAVRLAKFPRFDKERQRVEHRFHLE